MSSIAHVLSGAARWCVLQEDCLDVMADLRQGGEQIDCCVTDPPYGVNLGDKANNNKPLRSYDSHEDTYDRFVSDIVPRLHAAIDLAKRSAIFTGRHIHEQRKPSAIGGVISPGTVSVSAWGWLNFNPVLFYGASPQRGSMPTVVTIQECPDRSDNPHPCPKPIAWMLWLVGLASLPDEVVFDPFAGSGTTGVAALRLGRRAILIEKDSAYADIARDRMSAEADGSTLHARRIGQGALFG